MLFYRIFSFVIPISIGLLIGLLFWRVNLTYPVLAISSLISFFGTWWLINDKIKSKKELFFYSFFSLLQVLSGLTLFLFVENLFIKIALAGIIIFLNLIYLNELFNQYFKNHTAQLEKIWLLFYSIQIILVFFISTSLLGLRDFLGVQSVYLIFGFFILVLVLSGYNNWQEWNLKTNQKVFRIIISLLIGQIFWAVSLLPLVYYLKGIVIAIFYSIIISLVNWTLGKRVKTKLIRNYLIISILLIMFVFITAQWF